MQNEGWDGNDVGLGCVERTAAQQFPGEKMARAIARTQRWKRSGTSPLHDAPPTNHPRLHDDRPHNVREQEIRRNVRTQDDTSEDDAGQEASEQRTSEPDLQHPMVSDLGPTPQTIHTTGGHHT
jgi:hypothetical protein